MNEKTNVFKKMTSFREFGVLVALLALVVIFAFSSPIFLSGENMLNITRQVSVVSLLAIGMTLVIVTGGIDLSVSAVIAAGGIITASAMRDMNLSIPVAIIMGLSAGIITGIVNGVLIALLNMPAFITTMGTMTIIRGLGFIYTGAYPVYGLPAAFKTLGQGYVGIVPIPTIIFVAVALIASFILRKTVFGRHIYAIGGNESAAKLAGIRVPRIKIAVYILSGFIASIAAVIQAARIGAGMPTIGEGFELDAVAAAVIGGAAMSGGSGTVLGTVLGSIVLGVLSNGLSLLDVDSYVMEVIRGLVVIIAVLADQLRIVMANRAKIKSAMQALKQESEAKEK